MRKMPWALCLWPGLPQLARHGSWPALAVAVAAASLLNVVLLATFVWTDLVSPQVRIMYWLSLGVAWSARRRSRCGGTAARKIAKAVPAAASRLQKHLICICREIGSKQRGSSTACYGTTPATWKPA